MWNQNKLQTNPRVFIFLRQLSCQDFPSNQLVWKMRKWLTVASSSLLSLELVPTQRRSNCLQTAPSRRRCLLLWMLGCLIPLPAVPANIPLSLPLHSPSPEPSRLCKRACTARILWWISILSYLDWQFNSTVSSADKTIFSLSWNQFRKISKSGNGRDVLTNILSTRRLPPDGGLNGNCCCSVESLNLSTNMLWTPRLEGNCHVTQDGWGRV